MTASLKLRLASLVALATTTLAGVAGWGIWKVAHDSARERVDTMLRSPGRRLAERTGWNTDWKRFNQSLALVFGENWQNIGICRVVGSGPRFPVYFESSNWPEDLVLSHPENEERPADSKGISEGLFQVRTPFLYNAVTWPDQRWRMVNLANQELTIHLGVRTDRQQADSRRMATRVIGAVAGLTGLMFALTWLVARQSLRPVAEIARAAGSISERHLDQRIDLDGRRDREFAELIDVFNEMIARLERGFHQAARFGADASHELKTPIANLYGDVTARLQRCETGSDEQRFLAGVVDELDRIRSVLTGLLLLAKADGGRLDLTREAVVAADYFQSLADDAGAMTEEAGLRFEHKIECGFQQLHVDPVMLSQAMHNLIRNAVEYNCGGGFVRVEVTHGDSSEGSGLTVRVINSGPPIEGHLRAQLFGRFRKGHTGGHGLGLNIVREIAEAHGGKVDLEKSDADGTVFKLTLETVQPPPSNA